MRRYRGGVGRGAAHTCNAPSSCRIARINFELHVWVNWLRNAQSSEFRVIYSQNLTNPTERSAATSLGNVAYHTPRLRRTTDRQTDITQFLRIDGWARDLCGPETGRHGFALLLSPPRRSILLRGLIREGPRGSAALGAPPWRDRTWYVHGLLSRSQASMPPPCARPVLPCSFRPREP